MIMRKKNIKIENYKILKILGEGGMGEVYLALDLKKKQKVALKLLKLNIENKEIIKRFLKEIKALSQLNHPNIIKILDCGQSSNYIYFVMEYLKGESLYKYLSKKNILSEKEALIIVRQICLALHYAYKKHIIHRDIKPDNIFLLKESKKVKVMDWGIAKELDSYSRITETGTTVGTPEYMSPEQIRGERLDCRSDMYSIGCTLYEMVTGRIPFEGKNPAEIINKQLWAYPTPPSKINPNISKSLEKLILRLLHKKPYRRYGTYKSLIKDIDAILEGKEIKEFKLVAFLGIILGIILLIFIILFNLFSKNNFSKKKSNNILSKKIKYTLQDYRSELKKIEKYIKEHPTNFGEIIKRYTKLEKEVPNNLKKFVKERIKFYKTSFEIYKERALKYIFQESKRYIEKKEYQKSIEVWNIFPITYRKGKWAKKWEQYKKNIENIIKNRYKEEIKRIELIKDLKNRKIEILKLKDYFFNCGIEEIKKDIERKIEILQKSK